MSISLYGLLITAATLGAFIIALTVLDLSDDGALTISFMTLAFAQLWHVFNMRDHGTNLYNNEVVRNPYIWVALALCIVLIVAAVYMPGLSDALSMVLPNRDGWILAVGASLIPIIAGPIVQGLEPHWRKQSSLKCIRSPGA